MDYVIQFNYPRVLCNSYCFDVADDLVGFPYAPFLDFDDHSFSGLSLKNYERIS